MTDQPTTLITGGTVVTLDDAGTMIPDGYVLIRGDGIDAVGPATDAPDRAGRVIDARGCVVMPGLINAHHHLYSTLARGFSPPGEPAANFQQILERLWWKVDRALTAEDVYLSAAIALAEAVRFGCTTVIDHHASPSCCDGSLDVIERAFRDVGLGGCLCYEVSDRNAEGEGIEENVRFLRRTGEGSPMMQALFGLHASMTLSDETLKKCGELGRELGAGFHVHVAEAECDVDATRERFGARLMDRFRDAGMTGPRSLFAHGIHLEPDELDILAETDSMLVTNPESNMNNGLAVSPVLEALDRGITVGLGTDGMAPRMIAQARALYLIHRAVRRDPRVAFVEAADLLLKGNRDIARRVFGDQRGVLAPGAPADVAVFPYDPFTPLDGSAWLGHLLFGLEQVQARWTLCRGTVVVEEGRVTGLDESALRAGAVDHARGVWNRIRAM